MVRQGLDDWRLTEIDRFEKGLGRKELVKWGKGHRQSGGILLLDGTMGWSCYLNMVVGRREDRDFFGRLGAEA